MVGHPADWQVGTGQTGGLSVVTWIGCGAACQKNIGFVLQEFGVGPKQECAWTSCGCRNGKLACT